MLVPKSTPLTPEATRTPVGEIEKLRTTMPLGRQAELPLARTNPEEEADEKRMMPQEGWGAGGEPERKMEEQRSNEARNHPMLLTCLKTLPAWMQPLIPGVKSGVCRCRKLKSRRNSRELRHTG
ncbi:hypothetical protein NDU88_001113 [Pleurodeles waltl]|uniref:Uncharacterized protein n=1 Tax=Pleurodeles waltl TaxID=8319 RepID=A0AAV7UV98_PLEWA|nr:hypothetical protein NDU88_001113 [Pleurodeles waltl]